MNRPSKVDRVLSGAWKPFGENPTTVTWVLSLTGAVLSIVGYAIVWLYGTGLESWQVQAAVIGQGYVFLWSTSGRLVNCVLDWAEDDDERTEDEVGSGAADTASAAEDHDQNGSNEASADGSDDGEITKSDRDVGTIVGKAENVLLPTFILADAYTALSVVFAAKGLVRREDIQKNTLYYLAGTMTNVTYSVAVALFIRISLQALGVGQVVFLNAG